MGVKNKEEKPPVNKILPSTLQVSVLKKEKSISSPTLFFNKKLTSHKLNKNLSTKKIPLNFYLIVKKQLQMKRWNFLNRQF